MFKSISRTLIVLGIIFISVMGLTYGTFIYSNESTKATQMIIGDLTYGIDITASNARVSGKTVNVSSNTTSIVNLKVTSLNEVDTKYGIDYKILSGSGTVKYASNTGWLPTGKLSKTNYGTYEKLVKIVINATSDMSVDFTISGGYSENELTETKEGYTRLTEKSDNITSYNDTLTNVTEKEANNYIYGGESVNNYLQYPINDDNTKNIWRIIGYYNGIGTKIISSQTSDTTKSALQTDLTSFYNTLENQDRFIIDTDKFNCTTSSCTSSSYSKIGLISVNEYNELGGVNSYLSSTDNFFALDDNTIKSITPTGIEESETSGLKPTVYLHDYVTVTGTGTVGDPFKLKLPEYTVTINVVNGSATLPSKMITRGEDATYTLTPNTGYKNVIQSDTCNGTYSGNTYTISGVTENKNCTITFSPETYTLTLDVNGGNALSSNTKTITYNSTYGELPTPTRTGYTFNGWYYGNTKITSSTKVTLTSNHTLKASWTANTYTLTFNPNGGSVSTTSKTVTFDSTYGTLPTPTKTGYTFKGWHNQLYSSSFNIEATTHPWTFNSVIYNLNPGETYNISIDNAKVTSGSATQFTTLIYDFSINQTISPEPWSQNNFGSNIHYSVGSSASATKSADIRLLIYSGVAGSTSNIATSFTGVNIYSTNKISKTTYTSVSKVETPYNHQLLAEWELNKYNVTLSVANGSGSTTKSVSHGSSVSFTVTPSSGYKAELETNSCGGTLSGSTYTVSNVTSTKTCNISFKKDNTFYTKLLSDKSKRLTRTDFSAQYSVSNSNTLFTSTENGTTVYYFAGVVQDNWVKFGGYYWRIIRTNADGSIRLLFHSTTADSNSALTDTSASYDYDSAGMASGYSYSNASIKSNVNSWYNSFKTKTAENGSTVANYISTTAIYCSDTSMYDSTYFSTYNRILTSAKPTYDCTGSSALTGLGAALISIDEVIYSGGSAVNKTINDAWYFQNSEGNNSISTMGGFWTMSPHRLNSGTLYQYYIATNGTISSTKTYNTDSNNLGIRPVISLKSSVTWVSGDGSASNPYQVGL